MVHCTLNNVRAIFSLLLGVMFAVGIIFAMTAGGCSKTAQQPQGKSFASPEEAVKALIDACKRNDTQELITIFGPEGKEVLLSGDEVADKTQLATFIENFDAKNWLDKKTPGTAILYAGKEDWPFPIPIVKKGEKWYFDVATGKEEFLNRRIGRNELQVIKVMNGYVDAQREYASKDRDNDGVLEFAQKVRSEEGKKDGLYWPANEGEEMSPLGPFAAQAAKEGYKTNEAGPIPYHGYYYKILTSQGKNAPGGEYDYVVNGNMIFGYALIAFPADYGNSGVMTFIINQHDTVFEKDLGKETATLAATIEKYDPDESWKKVGDVFLAAD